MGLMTNDFMMNVHNDSKKFGYQAEDYMFSTDFPNFDWCNAQVGVRNGEEFIDKGFDMGKTIMISGKPGCGKTTFGIQLCWSVMKKYDESTMFYLDYEGAFKPDRVMGLTGMTEEEVGGFEKDKDGNPLPGTRVQVKQIGIYRQTILQLACQLRNFKLEHKKELMVENKEGIIDPQTGKLKKILPPTFIFVDSISGIDDPIDPKKEGEVGSLTEGARDAIMNKKLFKRLTQPCLEANIIVVAINQETQNMGVGVAPAVASTRFLKNTQAVGGGSGIQFFTNLWINIEALDKFDLNKNDRYGDVIGFRTRMTIVKSRNAEGGRTTNFVFDQRNGYDRDLSLFEVLYDNGVVKGTGSMYLPGLETVKFRLKTIRETLATNQEFRNRFEELALETLRNSVTVSRNMKFKSDDENLSDSIEDEGISELTPEVIEDMSLEDVAADMTIVEATDEE